MMPLPPQADSAAIPVVFSHANSFPLSTYRLLLALLQRRGIAACGIERLGHDARHPVTSNWPHLVEQLAEFASAQVQRLQTPVFLVGHSLGGILSVMTAARYPHLARGVLMLDAPLLGGWRANAVRVVKRTRLIDTVTPGKISQRRRTTWDSNQHALEHFRNKKAFAHWHPQVLQDYVQHALVDVQPSAEGKPRRALYFCREVETAIYNSVPHNLQALLRRHPLRCPAAFIGARGSREARQVGMELTERITHGRIMMLDGGHLFPMERPHTCAAAMEAALLNLMSQGPSS